MKSLNEYINESLLDGLDDLEKDSDSAIEKELIEKFLKENYNITGKYTINNGIVDVNGSVSVKNKALTALTNGMFVFGVVERNFYCYSCDKLKSLKGTPKEVGGLFDCSACKSLQSLEGSPIKVRGSFDCSYCPKLTSLEGAPEKVKGNFICHHCRKLTSLEGSPEEVDGVFDCSYCGNLTSLKGAPKEVGGSFYCSNCKKLKHPLAALLK